MNNSFNLVGFIKLLWKWRKPIIVVLIVTIIGSSVITDPHIMPPYYQSTSLIYPLNPNLTNSSNLFGDNAQGYFGGNADVDRILSIAGSVPLKMIIVQKFDLFRHYKIDSLKERYPTYAVLEELNDNYIFEKNDRGAIEITVQDHDHKIAAQMANSIVDEIDATNKRLLNENKTKILSIYETKLKQKKLEVQATSDSILILKQKFGLYNDINDLPSQVKASRAAEGSNYQAAMEKVKLLEEQRKGAIRELNNNTVLYEQYKSTIDSSVPTVYVLEKAFPAEKKSKPVRWLIVLASTLVAFLLSAFAVLLIEQFKNIKTVFRNA
jgi:capsular polysaccharide biosynthesis protein